MSQTTHFVEEYKRCPLSSDDLEKPGFLFFGNNGFCLLLIAFTFLFTTNKAPGFVPPSVFDVLSQTRAISGNC